MTIRLYELTDSTRTVLFSPYCWRTRMALRHKGISFESVPWHFTDTDAIAPSGQSRVPVLVDGERWIHESMDIAHYLDRTYPDRPALMPDRAAAATARFVEAWCNTSILPNLRMIAVPHVFKAIHDKDKAYFRESREAMLGCKLEDIPPNPDAERVALAKALQPAEMLFQTTPYFGGDTPSYADYVLFGSLMWPYQVCPDSPLAPGSALAAWFERLLGLNDGFARASPRVHG